MRTRIGRRDDTGATLLLALIIITMIALVIGAVLSEAFSSVATTLALRDQGGAAYAGDGAAQAAINQLRTGTFNYAANSHCFGSSDALTLPKFYPAANGLVTTAASSASSATVVCAGEAGTGAQGSPAPVTSANKPGYAVMTLGTTPSTTQGEGQNYAHEPIGIHGGVISNADISAAGLTLTGGAQAFDRITPCVIVTPGCTAMSSNIADPSYPPPTDPPAPPASMPTCANNKIAEFLPGLYSTTAQLNTLNNCNASWMLFDPGTYYFDFTASGSHVWTARGTIVGGTPTGAKSNTAPAVPGACVNPITTSAAVGVEFVFGGDTQVNLGSSNWEICASYHATSIPTAIYGLKTSIVNGANTAHAQSGCVITVGGCPLFTSTNGGKPVFYSQGFAYAPKASMNLQLNNSPGQIFNFGLVLRGLYMDINPQLQGFTLISIPDNTPGYGTPDTIVDLEVHVCPGAATCDSSGKVQLRARVSIHDPSGTPVAGSRQMTVLSWSEQR